MIDTGRIRNKKGILSIVLEIFMILLAVVYSIPFYYLVVNTLKTGTDAAFNPMSLPEAVTFENYTAAFNQMLFFNCFKNNVVITAISVLFIVMFCSMAAYPISRRRNKTSRFLKFYFVAGLMIPLQATITTLYSVMKFFHLINSIHGIIILYVATSSAFNIFMYQGFMNTIPGELDEAANIDGCGTWRKFWSVIFPLLKPITATVIVYNAMMIWNDFLSPLLFLQSRRNITMVLEIYRNIGQFSIDWSMLLTMMVITLIPVFIFFIFMQKYIIKGLTGGAIKG